MTLVRELTAEVALLAVLFMPLPAGAQGADAPQLLGRIIGHDSPQRPSGVALYGTDLGWTFEHRGKIEVLFGDSWTSAAALCSEPRPNDDALGFLPLRREADVPSVDVLTQPDAPDQFEPIRLLRAGQDLLMSYERTPLTGFSDGAHAYGLFSALRYVECSPAAPDGSRQCPGNLTCLPNLGQCDPVLLGVPSLCDVPSQQGCYGQQTCVPTNGYCADFSSSQPAPLNVAFEVDLARQRDAAANVWDSGKVIVTNKFLNPTARTVSKLSGKSSGNVYRSGQGALLIWGRPGFTNDAGGVGLYLMQHGLPLTTAQDGSLDFHPTYFAGLTRKGEPRWSTREEDAAPIALDGNVGGDPSESHYNVNQFSVTWLDAPIRKWVMLYGGGLPPYTQNAPPDVDGSVMLRFADHPWGPWSPPTPHLSAGEPGAAGGLYGPGGVLYHYACVDQDSARCAPSDPFRPIDVLNGCQPAEVQTDVGILYGVNIIEPYTERTPGGGMDVFWTVSTWNPYTVQLVRSHFHAR